MVKLQTALALGLIAVFFYLGGVGYTKTAISEVKAVKEKINTNLPNYTLKAGTTLFNIRNKLSPKELPPPIIPEEPKKDMIVY